MDFSEQAFSPARLIASGMQALNGIALPKAGLPPFSNSKIFSAMKTIDELAALLPGCAILNIEACKKVKGGENAPPPPPEDDDLIGNDDIIDG